LPRKNDPPEQMNLTTSLSDSDRLPNTSETSSSDPGAPHDVSDKTPRMAKPKKESGKGGVTDLDLPLKLQAARALSASGYYCKVNVSLSALGGHGLSDVTDVDVLAIRHDVTFRPTTMAVSCKSGEARSLSPSREIFYVRGVLNYFDADEGVVLFSRKSVPQHLKELGRNLGVLVLSGVEVDEWLKSLLNGVGEFGYFDEKHYLAFIQAVFHPAVETLSDYLFTDYWFYKDFRNLQNVIGHYKKVSPVLKGDAPWHKIVVLETAIHLAFSVLQLCRHIRSVGRSGIGESTAAYLFGGVTSFKARRDLYARVVQLLTSTGMVPKDGPVLPPLEPAYTPALAELVVRLIERPHSSVLVPQILQEEIWRTLGASGLIHEETKRVLATQKLAQDLLDFLRTASGAAWGARL
jgi:hypothetical protein